MKRRIGRIGAVLLWAGAASSASAQGFTPKQCLSPAEAEPLVRYAIPDVLDQLAVRCSPQLPAGAFLKTRGPAFSNRFRVEQDAAWPGARAAMLKLLGDQAGGLLQSDFARPILSSMIGPVVVEKLDFSNCPTIDRTLALIEPLPTRNIASLLVLFGEIGTANVKQPADGAIFCPVKP